MTEYAVAYTYGDCHILSSRERAEQWLALAKGWDARGLKAYSGARIVTRTTTTTYTTWTESLDNNDRQP